jgi:hypothetical protein
MCDESTTRGGSPKGNSVTDLEVRTNGTIVAISYGSAVDVVVEDSLGNVLEVLEVNVV